MKFITAIVLLIFSATTYSASNEDIDELLHRFSQAKITEACRLFNQNLTVQSAKQLPGVDDFLIGFWTDEANKQGYKLEEFATQCVTITNNYTDFLQAMESIREGSEQNLGQQ